MCRSLAFVASLIALAPVMQAQAPSPGPDSARARLARAELRWAQFVAGDSASRAQTAESRRAVRFDAGPVTMLLPASVGEATGRRVAAGAAAYLAEAVPSTFVASHVVVAIAASGADSALHAAGLASRERLLVDAYAKPDSLADGWVVAAAVANGYRETLDTAWRGWLFPDLGIGWSVQRDGPGAVRDLMMAGVSTGADCLGGDIRGCRLWLGLDADPNPYQVRYRRDDLRRALAARSFAWGNTVALARQCLEGLVAACTRAASLGLLPAVPAGPSARGSVLAFIRARGGPDAVTRALRDSSGAIGDRLARTLRLPEDSLVGEWRIWVLTGGGRRRVTANLRDALPVVFFGALLLWAATRSGRWR